MQSIKSQYNTADLATLLNVAPVTIRRRAERELWSFDQRPERLGGNAYIFEDLPHDVREVIIARALNTDARYLADIDGSIEELEARFKAFECLPKAHQEIARARADILDACRAFVRMGGYNVETGREAFAQLYNKKMVSGLDPGIYEAVKSCSGKTIERWQSFFNRGGLADLAPRYSDSGRNGRVSPDMAMTFRAAIAVTPHIRVPKLVELMQTNFPKEEWVHRATVHRWFQQWKKAHPAEYEMNRDPSAWKNKFMPAFGSYATATYAGQIWEMDSTPADIMTSDGKRCAIVAAIDVYSRRAVMVVVNTSNSNAVAACIRKGLLTFGKPETIRKDNGADYSSNHIDAVTTSLDIDTPPLPPYSPEHKGFIERFFGTMTRDLEEMLPGYTGHSVAERAALRAKATWARHIMKRPDDPKAPKPKVNVPLTQAEFMHIIECWLDVYENRVHSGFHNEPGRKRSGLTPRQAFEGSRRKPPVFKNERVLDILLAKVGERIVGKKGIKIGGDMFNDPILTDYIGYKVSVALHPDEAGAICVFKDGRFLCMASNEPLSGIRRQEYEEAKARSRKRIKKAIKGAELLSDNMDVSYTAHLVTGQISSVLKDGEEAKPVEPSVIEFRPEYHSPAVEAAQAAVDAYDGIERPKNAGGVIDFEEGKSRIIEPRAARANEADLIAMSGNMITLFEYYYHKATNGEGITEAESWRLFKYWDDFPEVQGIYPRPNESELKIIKAADDDKTEVCL
ncbi:hypothetical protein C4J81_10240 [Deltaproteobacteria bacterium Smac51]|nr:hypothetical protein C4J81_10240 [Deltaproteobacteria bacterium Smac51]